MVLNAVEVVPVGSNPSVTDGVHIFIGERHGFGASAPLSTMASSLQGRAGGSVESSPGLDRHIGLTSIRAEELLSPCFTGSAATASYARLLVLMSGATSGSMARRGCRYLCSRPAKRGFVSLHPRGHVQTPRRIGGPYKQTWCGRIISNTYNLIGQTGTNLDICIFRVRIHRKVRRYRGSWLSKVPRPLVLAEWESVGQVGFGFGLRLGLGRVHRSLQLKENCGLFFTKQRLSLDSRKTKMRPLHFFVT